MATHHIVHIPSLDNAPNPSGTPINPDLTSPTSDNPWSCPYPCVVEGHTDTLPLLWDGSYFSLPNTDDTVDFVYDPPLN